MDSIMNALENFEKVVYKILLWFILIPKTIVKIIINPSWAPDYISGELNQTGGNRFDEYMSPMLLFLLVILIPILGISFLPEVGTKLNSPAEGEITCAPTIPEDGKFTCLSYLDENNNPALVVRFEAESTFISNTMNLFHEFKWLIEQDCSTDPVICNVEGETHNEIHGTAPITSMDDDIKAEDYDEQRLQDLQLQDSHTVKDVYYYPFYEPGSYRVTITSDNFPYNDEKSHVETTQERSISLYIPEISGDNPNPKIHISYDIANGAEKKPEDPQTTIKSPRFIFLGLGLLLLPLLFSLATNTFKGSDISEVLLRESFYTQCYYFVPVGLVFWAVYYSYRFYTSDMPFTWTLLVILICLLIIPWFFATEINAIYQTRKLRTKWMALGVLILCILVILVLASFLFLLIEDIDRLRKSAMWAFPVSGMAIISFLLFQRFGKSLLNRSKTKVSNAKSAAQ